LLSRAAIHRGAMPLRQLILLVLLPWRAVALEVVETRWGFDGTVVPGHVNPLSLLVRNETGAPIDGTLTLRRGRLGDEGAPWLASLYLAPGTARWVQLYPLIEDDLEFNLLWSGTSQSFTLPEPRRGAPATVLLTPSATAASAVGGFRQFPDELFPTTVSATDGLDAIALDHAPRWQPAQRRAFRDWLARGGTLHLLLGPVGETWALDGDLADLERPERDVRVGAGRVLRYDCARREFTPEQASAGGHAPLVWKEDVQVRLHPTATAAVRAIASGLRPQHAWGSIYAVLIAFVACMGPLPWLLVRLGVPCRWAHLLMVGAVVGATWSLALIGRRGYGERAAVHALALARSLGVGSWEVRQSVNAFVTASDSYAFTHRGAPNLYSASGDDGADAVVLTDRGGSLVARIPLYSSRTFEHCARLDGPKLGLTVLRNDGTWKPGGFILELAKGSDLDAQTHIKGAALLRDGRIYRLSQAGELELADEGTPLVQWCELANARRGAYYGQGDVGGYRDGILNEQLDPLVAEAVSADDGDGHWTVARDPSQVSVFILADLPPEFQLAGAGFIQYGRVLYRIELRLDGQPTSGDTK
jgi:hypothetical protein